MTVGRGHYTMTFRGTRLARGAGAGAVSTRLNMQQTEKRHSSRRSRIGEVSRWALVILASVLVCLLAGWIISARTEKQYQARASIFVRGNSRAIALPSELSSLASMMQGPEPTSYAMALLESADFAREIVKKLSLLSNPDFTDGRAFTISTAPRTLQKMTRVEDNRKGLISVQATSKSPELAAELANGYVDHLMSKVASANARKRIYIGGKIGDLEAELNALEERQRELSSRESIVNLPEQTRAAVEALAQLESRLQEIETSLKGVNSDLTNTGQLPELAKLKAKKSSLEAQQAEVRRAIADSNARLKSVPAAALEQARLQREIDLKAKLFQSLSEQHQLAQIDEQSDARVYQVVDRAHVPVRPARPNLPVNLALSLILGAALGIAINILISDLASEAAGDF